MKDRYGRTINYLRISVTDRCNLRCVYCMPPEGVEPIDHKDILSFEEIMEFTKTAVKMGMKKVRLTGGEPLVRKGIDELVKMLAGLDGVRELCMTTNGILLTKYAEILKKNGLDRVNISLDATDPDEFHRITRLGNVRDVFAGIDAAERAGFKNIKINTVIKESCDEKNCQDVAKFCSERGFEHRQIRKMDLENGKFWPVIGGEGGNCSRCSRLRLTSDGKVLPCLFSDISYNVRELGVQKAIEMAVENKPEKGKISVENHFYSVGG